MTAIKKVPVTKRTLYYWSISRHHGLQILLLAIILISVFLKVVPLELQKRIVNEAISQRNEYLLLCYCGIFLLAVLLAGLSKYLINMLQVIIGQKTLIGLRTELYMHMLHLPLQRYRGLRPGSAISAVIGELNAIGSFLGQALAVPLTSIITYVVVFGYMFSLSRMLTLITIAIYPFELIVIPLLQKKFNTWNQKRIATVREMSDTVNEAINGIVEIQSYNRYQFEKSRLGRLITKLYHITITLSLYKFGIKFSGNFFQALGPFLLFLVGGHLAINGQFSLGALVAFLSAHEKLYDPWQELRLFYQDYQNALVTYRQITRLFDHHEALPPPAAGQESRTMAHLELCHVYYHLPGNITLLRDVSLTIHQGEHIALIGASGCGKSTLALVLAHLYQTSEGTIHIQGRDMAHCTPEDIRSQVAMVPQRPFIFSGTIAENIMYGVDLPASAASSMEIRTRIRRIIETISLEKDVVWLGMSSIPPMDKARTLQQHVLKMRHIVHQDLKSQFEEVVEFYDRDTFLNYATLRDNLIFGECRSGKYRTEKLPANDNFIALIEQTKLHHDLLDLGLALARITLEMLQQTTPDEAFFNNSPMKEAEVDKYADILRRLDDAVTLTREEENHLMILALRYIPAKHGQIRLQPEFTKKILSARIYFLSQIEQTGDCHRHDGSPPADVFNPDASSLADQANEFNTYCYSGYLYNRNIRTNILLGSVKKTFEDILRLKELAWDTFKRKGLLEEIIDLGLDFHVGSQGSHLSGGQKQKIAIARALLTDTPLLIMDEATASLDNISQSMFQEYISTSLRDKTIISIIHRLDLAHFYDRIIVMDNGAIVEDGTYDELMRQEGAFYRLYHNDTPQGTK